ncbi:Alpha/beta knot methyltransferase [Glomus cerebriforme]|uniref:rRNA methyltransferase 1, mitochondrial n=1 Tax=Glomus cerebriforme TaxID=658196 RepID=A0A397SBN3_9GLOM|nr:Alpha/beta knot methyltransferase [Glomus cerebriforme]
MLFTLNFYNTLVLRSTSILTKNSIIIYHKAYHWNADLTENTKNYYKNNVYKRSPKQQKVDFDYLYGLSVVLPALEQKRRKFHRLFVQEGFLFPNELNIPIIKTTKNELNKLLKDNRPHQGIILKASKLEPIKIACLGKQQSDKITHVRYQVIKPSNSPITLDIPTNGTRPFWLALDQVVDPQNLGAIIRSAYFFGVNGLVMCSKNSAPLSAVTAKASSGALEIMNVYDVDNLSNFLNCSSQNDWIIYGAVSSFESKNNSNKSSISINELNDPLSKNPVILVIGNEGTGLRMNILNTCHHQLYISSPNTNKSEYVDSLNVNAATAVLLQGFLGDKS